MADKLSSADILLHLANVISAESLADFPDIEMAQVQAVLAKAAALVRRTEEPSSDESLSGTVDTDVQSLPELELNKVLVVDDLEGNRLLMKHMFKDSGYTLIMASDAQEALLLAQQELPALIVSDIQMPVLSGLDLLQQLKSNDLTKNIAVILVTAHYRGSQQISEGLSLGADDYIQRPFMRDEFLSRIDAVIRVKRTEVEMRQHARAVAQRNKRLSLLNELAVAVNSSLDLQEIFTFSMQKLQELLGAGVISLILLNNEAHSMEVKILSHTGAFLSLDTEFDPGDKASNIAFQDQLPTLIYDLINTHSADLNVTPLPDVEQVHITPMISKEQLIGAIAVVTEQGGRIGDADWVLLNSASGIIAVAIENVHLLAQAQQQVDDLIALNEISRALTSTLDLQQILKQTTLLIQRILQAEAASLWLLDKSKREMLLIASSGVGSDAVSGRRLPVDRGIVGLVVQTGEAYISEDISKDRNMLAHVNNISDYSPNSMVCVPVQVKSKIIGVMQALHKKANWFNQNHLRLSYPVANAVGIAVENARLFSRVQDFNRQLEEMVMIRTKELADEKEKTEAILANMADGVLVLDTDNKILTANKAAEEMLDFQFDQHAGQSVQPQMLENPLWRSISDIAHDSQATSSVLVDVAQPQPATTETISENVISTQARSAKVHNAVGEVVGTVISLRDITALKEVERLKARFLAGITHELKTPLAVIQLQTNNLITYFDRLSEDKKSKLLQSIRTQSNLLSHLIESILDLLRLDAGLVVVNQEEVDLNRLVEQVTSELQPLAEAKSLALSYHTQPADVIAIGDQHQYERVLRNLIDNAIKYTPERGFIKVEADRIDQDSRLCAQFRVIDNGLGIPLQHQTQIFERFYRIDPSHTIPGTGLGLSIVKEIVTLYGGTIDLESNSGSGSKFSVTLPGVHRV